MGAGTGGSRSKEGGPDSGKTRVVKDRRSSRLRTGRGGLQMRCDGKMRGILEA